MSYITLEPAALVTTGANSLIAAQIYRQGFARIADVTKPDGAYDALILPEAAAVAMVNMENGTFEARRTVISPSGNKSGFSQLVSGDPKPPAVTSESLEIKIPVQNDNYLKRLRLGEIIMNKYTVASVKVDTYPGKRTLTSTSQGTMYLLAADFPYSSLQERGSKGRLFCTVPGYERYFINKTTGVLRIAIYRKTLEWASLPAPMSAQEFYGEMRSRLVIDPALVAETLADANQKSLDLLTSLAEGPETIAGVLKGLVTIKKLVTDFRSKNIKLSKAFRVNYDQIILDHKRRIDTLQRNFNSAKSSKRRRQIQNRILQAHIAHGRRIERTIAEANSALADIWLSFRYAIMPNVYLLDDILESQNAALSAYATSRNRSTFNDVSPPQHTGWVANINIERNDRAVCKRRYAPNSSFSRSIGSTLSFNPIVTIWELIPLSFVIDWFVNVGDYLASVTGFDFFMQEAFSYSWKYDGAVEYVSTNGVRSIYSIDSYERTIINPNDYLGLCVEPEINLKRAIDAVALSWAPIRRILLSTKR